MNDNSNAKNVFQFDSDEFAKAVEELKNHSLDEMLEAKVDSGKVDTTPRNPIEFAKNEEER